MRFKLFAANIERAGPALYAGPLFDLYGGTSVTIAPGGRKIAVNHFALDTLTGGFTGFNATATLSGGAWTVGATQNNALKFYLAEDTATITNPWSGSSRVSLMQDSI